MSLRTEHGRLWVRFLLRGTYYLFIFLYWVAIGSGGTSGYKQNIACRVEFKFLKIASRGNECLDTASPMF